MVERKIVALEYIPIEHQNANIFTKPLDRSKFEVLRQVISVIFCPQSSLALIVFVLHLFILCNHSSLLFCFLCFSNFYYITFTHFMIGCFIYLLFKKKKRKRKEKCVLHYFSWTCYQGWPFYLYITCLCTFFSLDELILLHFTSFGFVVHVVWELFIVFNHMILILKSHVFDCKD